MNMREVIDRICGMLSSVRDETALPGDLQRLLTSLPDDQLARVVTLMHCGRDDDREVYACHAECLQRFPTAEHRISIVLEMREHLRQFLSNGRDLCRAQGISPDCDWNGHPNVAEPAVYSTRLPQHRSHWTNMPDR